MRALAAAALALALAAAPVAAWAQATPQLPAAAAPPGGEGEAVPPQEEVPAPDAGPAPPSGAPAQGAVPIPPPAPSGPMVAVLQGLDKVTARISTIEVPVDGEARFGTLRILAKACVKSPPEEPPESAAFLEIWETPAEAQPVNVFSGWMFASSPALSALEHPVYDVWVKDCRTAAPESP